MPQLNEQQKKAVEIRGCNVLVSAAAGSGKTFVLTRRVAERITDPESPVNADQFLIVTFTRAAAAQMKDRIRRQLEERGDDPATARQLALLETAQIGTIDSFYLTLLREHGAAVGVPPTVAVSDESRVAQLRSAAVRDVLTGYYAAPTPGFTQLAKLYFSGVNHDALTDDLLDCLRFCDSLPEPSDWLKNAAARFEDDPSAHAFWQERLMQYAGKRLEYIREKLDLMYQTAERAGLLKWTDAIVGYRTVVDGVIKAAESGFEALREALNGQKLARRPIVRENLVADMLGECKEDISKLLKTLHDQLICFDRETVEAQRRQLQTLCGAFAEIAAACLEESDRRCRTAGVYGFADISRAAYRLLVTHDETGARCPTPLAEQLSRQYREIMIDEFQDVNELQYETFKALSDGKNLFMVGDVKQSIYRFRGSRPDIFLRIAQEYEQHPERGALLALNYNYRSHPAVLDAANRVFDLLMHRSSVDMEYSEDQRLYRGESTEPVGSGGFSLNLIACTKGAETEAEAAFIISRIRRLRSAGAVSDDGRKPFGWEDFCVIARTNRYLEMLQTHLEAAGIPCAFARETRLLEAPEIRALLALLRAINHPSDNIAMLAALLSPVWGFSTDDAAVLSVGNKKLSVYARVLAGRENADHPRVAEKCRRVIRELSCLQSCSVLMSVPELIEAALSVTDFAAGAAGFGSRPQDAAQCRENLAAFAEYAAQTVSSCPGGLPDFLDMIEAVSLRNEGPTAPSVRHGSAVTLMTVHHSKGLEFPVCFLAGCQIKLGTRHYNNIRWRAENDAFTVPLPPEGKSDGASWHQTILQRLSDDRERAEELRLLYVSMTRARNYLFASGAYDECEKKVHQVACATGGIAFSTAAFIGNSYADWLIAAALKHPDGEELRSLTGLIIPVGDDPLPWEISVVREFEQRPEVSAPPEDAADPALTDLLLRRLRFTYEGEELCFTPRKYTVTQLAAGKRTDPEQPAFLSQKRGARYGTQLHEFLQLCDFSGAGKGARALAAELRSDGKLSAEAMASLNFGAVEAFFKNPLFSELLEAKSVYKEYNFLSEIPIGEINPEISGSAAQTKVLLQGCADCIGVYDDHLLLIDYKSDRVQVPEELTQRYARQLELYARCLSEQFRLPVTRRVIYSFALNRAIDLTPPGSAG